MALPERKKRDLWKVKRTHARLRCCCCRPAPAAHTKTAQCNASAYVTCSRRRRRRWRWCSHQTLLRHSPSDALQAANRIWFSRKTEVRLYHMCLQPVLPPPGPTQKRTAFISAQARPAAAAVAVAAAMGRADPRSLRLALR